MLEQNMPDNIEVYEFLNGMIYYANFTECVFDFAIQIKKLFCTNMTKNNIIK